MTGRGTTAAVPQPPARAGAAAALVADGTRLVPDGPFAKSHEKLGDCFLIEVADLDEAIAERIPGARVGTGEVRRGDKLAGLPVD